jgi:hypothetical protein
LIFTFVTFPTNFGFFLFQQMPITFTKAVEDFIFAEFQSQGEKTNAGEARRRAKENFKNDRLLSIPSKDTVRRWFRNWKKNKVIFCNVNINQIKSEFSN